MKKVVARSKTQKLLSAEALSLSTGKPIRSFLENNPRVTSLPEATVVTTQSEIDNNSLKPAALGSDKRTSTTGQKAKKKLDPSEEKEIAEAVKAIGGILTSLSKSARFAVLKKICGAFGFKPKAPQEERKAKPKVTKSPFNEEFSKKTFAGRMLTETSAVMRKIAKGASEKPSKALHAVHLGLLSLKAKARDAKSIPDEQIPEGFDSKGQLQQLVGAVDQAFSYASNEHPNLPEQQIADAGWCLFQGNLDALQSPFVGIIPDKETWLQASCTVPRTEQEKETRTSELLASKKRRKKKRQKETEDSDSQGSSSPTAKRARSASTETEETSEGADSPDMDLA